MSTTTKIKIEGATKETARRTRDVLDAILGDLPIEGAKATLGRCTFDPPTASMWFKLTIQLPTEDGTEAPTPAAVNFDAIKDILGDETRPFAKHSAGDIFTLRGLRFRLVGFSRRARKRPILATNLETGEGYGFPVKTFDAPSDVVWEAI